MMFKTPNFFFICRIVFKIFYFRFDFFGQKNESSEAWKLRDRCRNWWKKNRGVFNPVPLEHSFIFLSVLLEGLFLLLCVSSNRLWWHSILKHCSVTWPGQNLLLYMKATQAFHTVFTKSIYLHKSKTRWTMDANRICIYKTRISNVSHKKRQHFAYEMSVHSLYCVLGVERLLSGA